MEAKSVVKNKFWIVEDSGQKIATIQAVPDGVVLVKGSKREKFVNFKLLSSKYNIQVGKPVKIIHAEHSIHGLPTNCKPHNVVYDVQRKLPFFSKTNKSKSFFCAGYYAICINDQWTTHFCPKSITVSRYKYFGPYATKVEAENKISHLNNL